MSEPMDPHQAQSRPPPERWRRLPPHIDLSETVEEVPSSPPNPPEIGDPDRDFMLRYAWV